MPRRVFCIYGPDGSGKSSASEYIRSILERRYGLKSKILWLRNNHYFTKLPLLLSKIMGHTHYDIYDGYRVGYYTFQKNYLVKGLYILCRLIDTVICRYFIILPNLVFTKSFIVIDRFIPDIIVDTSLYSGIQLHDTFLFDIFVFLNPKSSFIYIESSPEFLKSVRPENAKDKYFDMRIKMYKEITNKLPTCILKNNSTIVSLFEKIDEVVECVLNDAY